MLTYKDKSEIDTLVDEIVAGVPLFDLESTDGISHTLWRNTSPDELVGLFESVEGLYVADGHHRCAAAMHAAEQMIQNKNGDESGEYTRFPAVLIPMSQMLILAYNRVVFHLPGGPDKFRSLLTDKFRILEGVNPAPSKQGMVCMYMDGDWLGIELPPSNKPSVVDSLDVARLSEFVLEPILAISDPRTDSNVDFVGGARGTDFLEQLVDSGRAELAISLFPTQIEDLVTVSDSGMLMPPKSTWFEPKLLSGLLVHEFYTSVRSDATISFMQRLGTKEKT
jgi:uncharacterized protein (DUF1015 family)